MKKHVELPLVEPLYSTYHSLGPSTAIAVNNPSIRNHFLNHSVSLVCNRRFLTGLTTPEIIVLHAAWWECPYIETVDISDETAMGNINAVIQNWIDDGYYVQFNNVDDYYVEGKSWYRERHIGHDGLICGYDQFDKTYCIYAYDKRWIYQKFWASQNSFNAGCESMIRQGCTPGFVAIKAKEDHIEFYPWAVYCYLKEYLDSDLTKYPFAEETNVYGIVVHAFIAEYIDMLYRESIPYERMDRRILRMLWEHKKTMRERIQAIELWLGLNGNYSEPYDVIVSDMDMVRMLYAAHHKKRRDSVLPIIKDKLLEVMEKERHLLNMLIEDMGRKFESEIVETP